jgi:hypothetical protein
VLRRLRDGRGQDHLLPRRAHLPRLLHRIPRRPRWACAAAPWARSSSTTAEVPVAERARHRGRRHPQHDAQPRDRAPHARGHEPGHRRSLHGHHDALRRRAAVLRQVHRRARPDPALHRRELRQDRGRARAHLLRGARRRPLAAGTASAPTPPSSSRRPWARRSPTMRCRCSAAGATAPSTRSSASSATPSSWRSAAARWSRTRRTSPATSPRRSAHGRYARQHDRDRPAAAHGGQRAGVADATAEHAPAAGAGAVRLAAAAELQPAPGRGVRARAHRVRRRGPYVRAARPAGVRPGQLRAPQGAGAARAVDLGGGARLGVARATRRDDRRVQEPDRLAAAGRRRGAADAGRTLAVMEVSGRQRSRSTRSTSCACSGAGCACSPSPTSRSVAKAWRGVRRRRPDEAVEYYASAWST